MGARAAQSTAQAFRVGRLSCLPLARTAGADEAINPLPDRYDTQLGREFHGGTELSVGQWQRIALARVFFCDAPLLILDEPKTGAIVEHGTHDELMATQGLYAELFTLQAASYTNDLGALHPPVDHTYSPTEKDPS